MTQSSDERLSAELGFDVAALEQQTRFRLDLARMQRGEEGELGYLLIERQHRPDVAVVFPTPDEARAALEEHPLIDSLCEEDCLDASVPDRVVLADLASREIILP